jgi:hypothetical protein
LASALAHCKKTSAMFLASTAANCMYNQAAHSNTHAAKTKKEWSQDR